MSKRILLCNDASFINTGYGIYGKEILSRLFKSGKYDIAELACFADQTNNKLKQTPWKVYPNAVPTSDQRYTQYKGSLLNQFGAWRFNRVLADFNPHIVFDIRDYWMFAYQETSPFRRYFHWIIMPTVDSAPQKTEWKHTFSNADIIVPYTEWAKHTLQKECGQTINLFNKVANAGINPGEFYIIDNKYNHKKQYFNQNYNIIGTVMRNQRRKLFADLLMVFKSLLNTGNHNNTILYLHTSFPEDSGWDLPSLLLEYGVSDKVYFTYICKVCKKFFPSKFKGPLIRCPHCEQHSAQFASPTNAVSTKQLNQIYNLFDIYIQYAICEGFGMPQVEAGACGLPVMSIDYSAMSEVVDNIDGYKIPCSLFREMETNALRALPDNNFTINFLDNFLRNYNSEEQKVKAKHIRKKCIAKYSWDNVYSVWEECFDSIDITKKIPWNHPEKNPTHHESMSVPKGLSKKEFIEYICNNVINEPYLLRTAPVKAMIRDFMNGIVAKGGTTKPMLHQDVVEYLESCLTNKNMCETMRLNKDTIIKEDFI